LVVQTDELTTIDGFTEGSVTPTNLTAGDYWLFLLAESNVTFRAITNQTNFWYRTDHPFGPLPTNVPALTGTMASTLTGYVVTAP
jgi:hypothetical protein